MESGKPQNMNHVIRETFYDMTLYLQAIFLLTGDPARGPDYKHNKKQGSWILN